MWVLFLEIALLLAPSLFILSYSFIKFPAKEDDWNALAIKRWGFLRTAAMVLIVSWIIYGIFVYQAYNQLLSFFMQTLYFLGVFRISPKITLFIGYNYSVAIKIFVIAKIIFSFILYLYAMGWSEQRIRAEKFPLNKYLRLIFFEAMHRLFPYLVLLILLFSDITPWIIYNGNFIGVNFIAAVTIIAISMASYFYSFTLFKILLNMATPLNNEYFQGKANEFVEALQIKVKRLLRLKTFEIPFVLAYATSNREIYLSDILIDKFPPEEATAILAHEISHLKHIKSLILKKFLFYTVLILGLFFLTPIVDLFTLEFPSNFLFKTLILLGLILFLRVESKISRNYELEADRLAVGLVGKDLYIKAIEKIHEMNMIPREFKSKDAKTQTHPSLEARIKAIQQLK